MAATGSVKQVVATGFVIYRKLQEEIQFLLLNASYEKTLWTPPKGHVDPGESEFETALRETQEEAGLTKDQLNIHSDFEKTLHYEVRGRPKRVVYWLAELKDPNTPIVISEEHIGYKWLDLENAKTYSKFPEAQELLTEAFLCISRG